MSTTKRLISGSAASWVRIGITLLTQVALVPIYLSYWSVQTYGIWITTQAVSILLTTLDKGHLDYLGYEFLKLGKDKTSTIRQYLWSGFWLMSLLGLAELGVLYALLTYADVFKSVYVNLSFDQATENQTKWVLLLNCAGILFISNGTGLFFRALSVYGYFPRMCWWDLCTMSLATLLTAATIMAGGGLLSVGIAYMAGQLLVGIVEFVDIGRLLSANELGYERGSLRFGVRNYRTSLALSARYFLESFRQQGIRLVLAPLVGAAGLAAFSTVRTGANVALQGISTITNPIMPELMRFVTAREQPKLETAFATVWLLLIAIMAPGILLLQFLIKPLFALWTANKVAFDPLLFALLSLGVLVYALAQPAMAIVVGNNLLKTQLKIFTSIAVLILVIILGLVPRIGIIGAGYSLFIGEVVLVVLSKGYAEAWLVQNKLAWPTKLFTVAACSVLVCVVGTLGMVSFPDMERVFFIVTFLALLLITFMFIRYLPHFTQKRIESLVNRMPFTRKSYAFMLTILNR